MAEEFIGRQLTAPVSQDKRQRIFELAEALYQIFTNDDLRQEMIERGWRNLQRFSWRQAAARSLAAYSDALGNAIDPAIAFT